MHNPTPSAQRPEASAQRPVPRGHLLIGLARTTGSLQSKAPTQDILTLAHHRQCPKSAVNLGSSCDLLHPYQAFLPTQFSAVYEVGTL
jgi:hypothetical protein